MFAEIVKEVFVQARVLDVVRSHLFFALNLDADLQTNRPGNCRFIGSLLYNDVGNAIIEKSSKPFVHKRTAGSVERSRSFCWWRAVSRVVKTLARRSKGHGFDAQAILKVGSAFVR